MCSMPACIQGPVATAVLIPLLALLGVAAGASAQALAPTLEIRQIDEAFVPFQNGIPYPTFEPQRRPVLNLAGEWRRERVKMDAGITLDGASDRLERVEAEGGGRHLPDYDDAGWSTLTLPSPENRLQGGAWAGAAERYEGGVWYRRRIDVPKTWRNRTIRLKFIAANYVTDVWVNGSWVGVHEGGYTPFAFDVTNHLRAGEENVIAVRVHNIPWGSRDDIVPAAEGTDWFNYTGVIQEVYLEALPPVHVERADVIPRNPPGDVLVTAVVRNGGDRAASVLLGIEVYEADASKPDYLDDPHADTVAGHRVWVDGAKARSVNLTPGEVRVVRWELRLDQPKLWSPESPQLYVARVRVDHPPEGATSEEDGRERQSIDDVWTQFGIRTLSTQGHRLLLNGDPVFLRGVARHEEWPESGRTATWAKIRSDLEMILGLHANFVRTAHYPNHPYTYILTDRLGLAAKVEIPVWQFTASHLEAQEERRIADQMWREMIYANFNRPSIWLWSTNNEGREFVMRTAYNRRLREDWLTHYHDGRLLTQSAAADTPGVHDASQAYVDVAGWTMYFGIFHGSTPYEGTARFIERAAELWPDKPILNTEFGMWAPRPADEARQLEVFRETYRALREAAPTAESDGVLVGMTWWTAFDWFVNHNRWTQTMGLADMDRERRKLVWNALREAYGELAAALETIWLPRAPLR